MASSGDPRARLQSNWGLNKQGGNDMEDTDAEELDVLTRQLSSQIEYNNRLLEHLQALEGSHLEVQQEMKKKEHALKLAVASSNVAKAEATDMSRKWAVASEVAETMTRKCEDAVREVERKEREVLLYKRQADEARAAQDKCMQLKAAAEDRMCRAEHELAHTKADAQQQDSSDKARIEQLSQNLDATAHELQHLRALHIPLSVEHKKAVHDVMALEAQVTQAHARLRDETSARDQAERRAKEAEAGNARLRDAMKELKGALQDEQTKLAHVQAETQALQQARKGAEEDVQAREDWLQAMKLEQKKLLEENKALRSELEHTANELLAQAKLRASEQERWAKKMAKAQEQLATVTEEARLQAQRHAVESQKRSTEALAAQREAEEQYLQLQAEHAQLHDMLKEAHKENQGRMEGFEEERRQNEAKIHSLNDQLAAGDVQLAEIEKALQGTVEDLREELKRVKAEMSARGSKYVGVLTALQEQVKALSSDGAQCREEMAGISNDFQAFQQCVQTFVDTQGQPLEAWYNEVRAGMDTLIEQNKELNKELEDRGDEVKDKDVKIEELKSEVLRQQADISSMRHEILDAEERLNKEKQHAEERLQTAFSEVEDVRKEKEEVERRLRRIQDTLDFANGQNKQLQEQTQVLEKQLASAQARYAATTKKLEDSLSSVEAERRVAERARLEVMQERDALLKTLQEDGRKRQALGEQVEALEGALERQEFERKAAEAKAQKKLQDTQQALQQSAKQVDHSQRLLQVMRQGKQQDAALRAENAGPQGISSNMPTGA